jgi:hypothetical protein
LEKRQCGGVRKCLLCGLPESEYGWPELIPFLAHPYPRFLKQITLPKIRKRSYSYGGLDFLAQWNRKMLLKPLGTCVLALGFAANLLAEPPLPVPKVGDQVSITMTGDLANEFQRCITGSQQDQPSVSGLSIQTTGTITQALDGGRFRIDNFSPVQAKEKPIRLVTFSTIVAAPTLKTSLIPTPAIVFASPASPPVVVPAKSRQEQKNVQLHLSELKGVKIRTWKLDEEIDK